MTIALAWWVELLLLVQCPGLHPGVLLTWPSLALVLVAALKLWEARTAADRRLVLLLQLVAVGLLAAQLPGLLPSLLQLATAVLCLAGLLQLEQQAGLPLLALVRRSVQLAAAALPLALVLFLLLPRSAPLWVRDEAMAGPAVSGLSASLDPWSITQLALRDAPAARVGFSDPLRGRTAERYWRVLVHERFDGRRWERLPDRERLVLQRGASGNVAAGPLQWWSLEPSRQRAVPWDGAAQPASADLSVGGNGELVLAQTPARPRSYRLQQSGSPPWALQPPGPELLAYPLGAAPRLEALAARWRALPTDQARLQAAEAWFRSQPFRYSLQPGLAAASAGLDAFLFEQRVGFCGHYASAFTALMRASGVPARVVSGYLGGRWVEPLGAPAYLDLRQSDAHAWSEVWLEGRGWQRVDPTRWIAVEQQAVRPGQSAGAAVAWPQRSWQWLQWQWWGLDLAWTRWWLGFDQSGPAAVLERLLGGFAAWAGAVVLLLAGLALALGLQGLRWRWPSWRGDPQRWSLRLLARLGVRPQPADTFSRLCARAAHRHPALADHLQAIADHQRRWAHAPLTAEQRRLEQRQWRRQLQILQRQIADP